MDQENHIPWNLLTTHLQYIFGNAEHKHKATNLFPRFDEDQDKDFDTFVETFTQKLDEAATVERTKYPEKYDPPDADAIILDDDLVKRISPIAHKLQLWQWTGGKKRTGNYIYRPKLCSHEKDDANCVCPIRFEERKASSFLRRQKDYDCSDFFVINNLGHLNMEIVKTLLVSGDMEPILRACSHPENDIENWWCVASCNCGAVLPHLGWDHVYLRALESYLCLNVLYRFAEIRDHHSHKQDYRQTKCYQVLLRESTIPGTEAVQLLHLEFFGLCEGQFSDCPRARADGPYAQLGDGLDSLMIDYPYGLMPIHDFLEFEKLPSKHLPTESEVISARQMLFGMGLPAEIALRILDLADMTDYGPRRRLEVPHDPFHRDNRAELERYLSQCWDVLLNCEMMSRALGKPIEWDAEIARCIGGLWMNGYF